MAFTTFRGMRPFTQLLFSFFVILVCFLAFFVLSVIIALPVWGLGSVLSISGTGDIGDPKTIEILKYFQTVQALGLFVVPPLILGWLYLGNIAQYLFLDRSFAFSSSIIVLVLMFAAIPVINLTGEINSKMQLPSSLGGVERWMQQSEENAARLTEAFLDVKTMGGLLFNIFMIALLPAIGEEFLFRGVIQRSFTRMTKNHHWGIWISAFFFSALHMQFYGFLPRFLLGGLFGYLLYWGGSMWLPIIAHFFNNAFAVLSMYLIDKGLMSSEIENFGSVPGTSYYAIISLALIAVLLVLFRKQNRGNAVPIQSFEEHTVST